MDSTKLLIFFFIGFGLTSCSNTYVREYHYVTESLNWTEAQKYCREKYTDLATIESVEDLSRLNRPSGDNSLSWIGLTDDPKSWKAEGVWSNDSNPWRWSATDKPSETGYHNWASVNSEQYRSDLPVCVCFHFNGYWYPCSCSSEYHFVCFNESNPPGQRNYTLITNQLTWIEAQTYCRTHHTDLATIENAQENAEVESMFTNSYAWIGLYRVPWRWSDNSSSSFTNWASGQPGDITQNCVAEDSTHAWHDEPCDRKLSFLCYKDLRVKKMTMVRMKIQTFADLSDPATHAQILQQLSERFKALHGDVKLRWVTQPTKQEEDDDEDKETCN